MLSVVLGLIKFSDIIGRTFMINYPLNKVPIGSFGIWQIWARNYQSKRYFKCLLWQFWQDWGVLHVSDLRKLSSSLPIQATTALSRQTEMPAKIFGENKSIQRNMSFIISEYLQFLQELFRYNYKTPESWTITLYSIHQFYFFFNLACV